MLLGARQFFERRGAPTPPLPYDAEVEYLQSTGTQYIVLGDVLMGKTFTVEGKWCPLETTNDRFIFGGGQHSNPLYSRTGVYGASNPFVLPGGESVDILQQGAIYIHERVDREYVVFRSYAMSSDYIYLFAQEWGNVPAGKITARLFYLRVSVNGEVSLDLTPVRFTNEQGVSEGAVYDRVSGALFRNAGTGAFLWAEKQ